MFRQLAAESGMSLAEFGEHAQHHPEIDRELDDRLEARAREGSCVIESRLAGWLATRADLLAVRVWIDCDEAVRAARVAERDGTHPEQAQRDNAEREPPSSTPATGPSTTSTSTTAPPTTWSSTPPSASAADLADQVIDRARADLPLTICVDFCARIVRSELGTDRRSLEGSVGAAVDGEGGAGDEPGLVGAEEGHDGAEVLGAAELAGGDRRGRGGEVAAVQSTRSRSVACEPGCTEFTVTPSAATSRASVLRKPVTPGPGRVGQDQPGDRLAHRHAGDGHDPAPAAAPAWPARRPWHIATVDSRLSSRAGR